MGRILSIDYGEKRIGLALSDISQFLASPYKTLENKGLKHVLSELRQIIQEKEVEEIVIGIPKTLKGTHSVKTKEVEEWIQKIQSKLNIPVSTMDERLTTVQAHQIIHAKGQKVGKKRKEIDQYSAAILLQAFLDRKRSTFK